MFQESFDDFDSSVMRVLVMSIGEFDYVTSLVDTLDQVSNETGADLVPYPEMTNFFFFLFVLIMPIILMNLLVSDVNIANKWRDEVNPFTLKFKKYILPTF